jgi:predicted glycoside hydrolase/deacetylase ChbG (UPF0249 family)
MATDNYIKLPNNIIINADDFGLNETVNKAILYCYDKGIINSTSLMTNKSGFEEAVEMIHANPRITNIGVHINFADGKPLTDMQNSPYINSNGEWDLSKTGAKFKILASSEKRSITKEIESQIEKAITEKVTITHLDSHHHLHTLPGFYPLFINVARRFQLKLRLAQTHSSGSYLKAAFRKYLNQKIKTDHLNYSDFFETVEVFTQSNVVAGNTKTTEIMLHPDFDQNGNLTDHYAPGDMKEWLLWLGKGKSKPQVQTF